MYTNEKITLTYETKHIPGNHFLYPKLHLLTYNITGRLKYYFIMSEVIHFTKDDQIF